MGRRCQLVAGFLKPKANCNGEGNDRTTSNIRYHKLNDDDIVGYLAKTKCQEKISWYHMKLSYKHYPLMQVLFTQNLLNKRYLRFNLFQWQSCSKQDYRIDIILVSNNHFNYFGSRSLVEFI